ncbi:unnamed protein product [Candida verbasci]|uniref:Thiamine pyrophosphokinase n=1 Tax=Candida verbasci TaxID=1227364 RepID=A0A9W4XEV8_9ASCO|nr:unnamed protein product [Candida verbasci]
MTLDKDNDQIIEQPDSLDIKQPENIEEYHLIKPFSFLVNDLNDDSHKVLLILNQFINVDLISIWNHCTLRLCADAGANRLFHYFSSDEERSKYIPDYIVGDFDSIDPETKSYYEKKGSRIIYQSSQYSNDFMKCVYTIQIHYQYQKNPWPEIEEEKGVETLWKSEKQKHNEEIKIFVLNAIGGRFDQTIQSINQIYILHKTDLNLSIIFITINDIIFLLYKGKNYIKYDSKSVFNKNIQPTCGLLPLGDKPVILNTWGLKWDVRNWNTKMTGKVSSSNRISGDTGFIVDASDDIVMNIELDT